MSATLLEHRVSPLYLALLAEGTGIHSTYAVLYDYIIMGTLRTI